MENWTAGRIRVAAWYDELLADADVVRPNVAAGNRHVYHIYCIRSVNRDALQQELATAGIQTAIHYAIPGHLQEAYRDPAYNEGSFPESEKASREVLALPISPNLTRDQISYVASTIRSA